MGIGDWGLGIGREVIGIMDGRSACQDISRRSE